MRDFTRQLGWFDPSKHDARVTVIGAGGIGGPTVLALAKMGITSVKVYDFDRVDAHNQPNQMYGLADLGTSKVEALKDLVQVLADTKIVAVHGKVTAKTRLSGVVISAVDSMDARRAIWSAVKSAGTRVRLFVDGRIGGQVIRVVTVRPSIKKDQRRYEGTLVPNHAVAPLLCTEAGIIDVSFAVAAIITRAVRSYLADKETISDLYYDHRNLRFLRS